MATIKLLASHQTTNDSTTGRYYGVSRDGFCFGPHKNTWIPDRLQINIVRFVVRTVWILNFSEFFGFFLVIDVTAAAFRKLILGFRIKKTNNLVRDISAQFRSLSCTTSSKIAIFSKFFNRSTIVVLSLWILNSAWNLLAIAA